MRERMNKKGQIVLLVILLGLLGLTLGLATLSRSLLDIKQTSQTDSGAKALAAADAMVEYAIANGTDNNSNCQNIVSVAVPAGNPNILSWGYYMCGGSKVYVESTSVGLNDVMSVPIAQINNNSFGNFNIFWHSPAAVEISYLDKNTGLTRYAIDSATSGTPPNNFSNSSTAYPLTGQTVPTNGCGGQPIAGDPCLANSTTVYDRCYTIPKLNNGDKLIRIRPLYQPTPMAVCIVKNSGNGSPTLNSPTKTFIGQATLTDGTVKRVQKTLVNSGLPGIFDYAIYTEGNLTK